MFYFDSTMIILLPALLISAWAQMKISSTYEKYSRLRSSNGYTGAQVARRLLDGHGLHDVPIEIVRGKLTDHYDPRSRVMRLSSEVYHGTSVAAIGVAAHETGHAFQHEERYSPLVIRNSIVPVANISSRLSWVIFFVGLVFSIPSLLEVGIYLFLGVVIFQLITLPVEFNASNRAMNVLEGTGILYGEEADGARKVLRAAAMTYVAAAITAISQLLRLIALSNRRRD
ncbi:zinc metallopeptidase [Clostridium sp. MSJ-11]|uniref:Zinc metallopeptidase n=1 Tax=Clostridium mobile TaxID=2841512 RepID=A0ABS6EC71_9CLOT|nr:zinc metallopeptidase [Clostridium mobile]MBU5482727.1 zinc metallopeptidase [Clostridium mobile]